MIKMIIRTAAVVAMIAMLAACQQTSQSGQKIAFVSANKVFQECQAGKAGVAYLKSFGEKFQSEFKEMQAEMAQNKTEENTAKFQKAITEYRTKMSAEQNRIIGLINDAFSKAVDTYRADNGIDAVLSVESAVSYDSKVDISSDIVSAMDKMDIKLIPEETNSTKAPEAAAEKTAPAEKK
jgi:outer membrane protein